MKYGGVAIAALMVLLGAATVRAGDDCGCSNDCCKTTCCKPGQKVCTVMKICKETVYEEQERTFYRQVFKEEMQDRTINTMEYVEETRYRCQPCTIWQPKADCCPACDAGSDCVSACGCVPPKPVEMVQVEIIKKVPYTVVVPKCVQKVEKVPRTVTTMEPYTVTVCIPHVVYTQVPVEVCCPASCCCGKKDCQGCCCQGTDCQSCGSEE
jgi:hypothetical protein